MINERSAEHPYLLVDRAAWILYPAFGAIAGVAIRVLLSTQYSTAMHIDFHALGLLHHVTILQALPWAVGFGAIMAAIGWKLHPLALPVRSRPWIPLIPTVLVTLPWLLAHALILAKNWGRPPRWFAYWLAEFYPPNEWMLFLTQIAVATSIAFTFLHLCPNGFDRLTASPRLLSSIPWGLAAGFFAVFATLNVLALLAGHRGYADSGFVAEALWNTLHGRFLHCNNFHHPMLLADHFSPIWLILIPAYMIYPDHATLAVLSALILASAIPLSYRLAMVHTGCRLTACAVAIAVFLYPPLTHENSSFTYGFSAEMCSLPILLAGFAYLPQSREWTQRACWRLYGFMFLALLCKENMALPVTMTGVYLCYQTRDWRRSIPMVALGFSWGLLTTRWLIPMLKGGAEFYQFDQFYGHLGQSLSEVVLYVITHPAFLMGRLAEHRTLTFITMLLLPVCLLAVRRLDLLAIGSATLFFLIIGRGEAMRSIQQHYKISLVAVVLVAMICSLSRNDKILMKWCGVGQKQARLGLLCALLVCAVSSAFFFGAGPGTRSFRSDIYNIHSPRATSLRQLKAVLPKEAVLYASHRAAGRFTNRPELYVLDAPHKREKPAADVVVVDLDYPWGKMAAFEAAAAHYENDPAYTRISGYPPLQVFARSPFTEILQGNSQPSAGQ